MDGWSEAKVTISRISIARMVQVSKLVAGSRFGASSSESLLRFWSKLLLRCKSVAGASLLPGASLVRGDRVVCEAAAAGAAAAAAAAVMVEAGKVWSKSLVAEQQPAGLAHR